MNSTIRNRARRILASSMLTALVMAAAGALLSALVLPRFMDIGSP